jgi:hypothetical protein
MAEFPFPGLLPGTQSIDFSFSLTDPLRYSCSAI